MRSCVRRFTCIAPVVALLLAAGCGRKRVEDRIENPPSGEKPLDLVADAQDDNGLPDAPRWQHQREGKGVPDPHVLCAGADGRFDLARCTSQEPTLDVAAGFADTICSFGTSHEIRGHANWWPVTYRGSLFFDEASIDLDYTFSFRPEGEAAVVTSNRDVLHVEFDSSETVGFFDTPWWNRLRDAARSGKADARALVDGRQAVLTGLFGLDCEHECHAELHPVYLLALQVNDAEDDDTWAFFARNWGNEGFCSRFMHLLALETVALRIPWRCGATEVTLAPGTVFKRSPEVRSDARLQWAKGEGVLVEVDLPPADPGAGVAPRVHGELHLAWTRGEPCAAPRRAAGTRPPGEEEENSAERRLEALAGPEVAAREAEPRSLAAGAARDVAASTPTMTRVEKLQPPSARRAARARVRVQEATPKLQRDEALLRAGCEAERGRSGRTPPECEPVMKR